MTFIRSLLCKCLPGLILFSALHGQERDPHCEFDRPEIKADYWPVYPFDPEKEDGTVPVVDIFLNRKGKATRYAVLNVDDEATRVVSAKTAEVMYFNPAIACGEYVDGFYRHAISTYFYLEDGEHDNLTQMPASAFYITREIQGALELLSTAADVDVLKFTLEVTPEGKVKNLRGRESEWAKNLGKDYLKAIAKGFVFKPARNAETPVAADLVLKFHLKDTLEGAIFEETVTKALKPMPRKPDSENLNESKIHSVELNFYENGRMQDIQFLTPMTDAESFAALEAFRKWRIHFPEDERTAGDSIRRITYSYLQDDDTAVLLKEESGPAIKPPVLKNAKEPEYPRSLLKERLSGVVKVALTIDKEGNVAEGEVVASSHEAFTRSIQKVIKSWQFQPGTLDGEPIATRVRIIVPFKFN